VAGGGHCRGAPRGRLAAPAHRPLLPPRCAAQFNVSPSFILELLERLARVFKDYCGVLTEEALRKNFILIYELLDEMIVRRGAPAEGPRYAPRRVDALSRAARALATGPPASPCHRPPPAPQDYGYPQSTSTEQLKLYVHNEPIAVEAAKTGGVLAANKKTISSAAVQKPISLAAAGGAGKKNEIFVDILERLTVLFNANVRRSPAAGAVAGRATGGGGQMRGPSLNFLRLPAVPLLFLSSPAGLRPQQHHRRVHPDEELLVGQPRAQASAERGPCGACSGLTVHGDTRWVARRGRRP
jgi:hypothetical protein